MTIRQRAWLTAQGVRGSGGTRQIGGRIPGAIDPPWQPPIRPLPPPMSTGLAAAYFRSLSAATWASSTPR